MKFGDNERTLIIESAEDAQIVSGALVSTARFSTGYSIKSIESFPLELGIALSQTALWAMKDVIKHHSNPNTRIDTAVALEMVGVEYDSSYLHPLYRQVVKDRLDVKVVEVG